MTLTFTKKVIAVSIAVAFVVPAFTQAASPVKANTSCVKKGIIKIYSGKKYTCLKKGKKLVWSKGVAIAAPEESPAPIPSTSPTPTPTPTPIPTPTPSPKPTEVKQSLSIAERWNLLDPNALKVFNEWAPKEIPKEHSIKIEYVLSSKADLEVVEEIKRRYDLAARFWAPYSTVTKQFKVLIANHNEVKWICEVKLAWLQMIQPDCEQIESNGRSNIPTAGQLQKENRNVDMYQVKNRAEMDTRFFIGRVEHEFTHNIFYEQSEQYQKYMPCWQIEGGAEYFGILIATRLDPNAFIQARNFKFETEFQNLNEPNWKLDDWLKFLNDIDQTDVPNRQGDTCGAVRRTIYHTAILPNEYLVLKVGIPGYLKLIRDASNSSWNTAIKNTFGVEKQVFYRDMAAYMMSQYQLAKSNRWSFEELYKIPPGN